MNSMIRYDMMICCTTYGSERSGERVAGVDNPPLQLSVSGADEQLQPWSVQVFGKVCLACHQGHVRQSRLFPNRTNRGKGSGGGNSFVNNTKRLN